MIGENVQINNKDQSPSPDFDLMEFGVKKALEVALIDLLLPGYHRVFERALSDAPCTAMITYGLWFAQIG